MGEMILLYCAVITKSTTNPKFRIKQSIIQPFLNIRVKSQSISFKIMMRKIKMGKNCFYYQTTCNEIEGSQQIKANLVIYENILSTFECLLRQEQHELNIRSGFFFPRSNKEFSMISFVELSLSCAASIRAIAISERKSSQQLTIELLVFS